MGDRSSGIPFHHGTTLKVHFVDALRLLGLDESATVDDVHAARRRLARSFHPDLGGVADDMVRVNVAVDIVLTRLRTFDPMSSPSSTAPATSNTFPPTKASTGGSYEVRSWMVDRPSFVIDVLPVDAFEWIVLAARVLGEIVDDDPPYAVDVLLESRVDRWCRLEIVPDAGSSTVSIVAENVDPAELVELWVTTINELTGS